MVAWTIASTTATAVAILLGLLAAWGASSIGLSLVNLVVTRVVSPRMLPKLDFSKGIPDEHRALVAVPTLMTSADSIRQLVDDLEIRFLANRDDNLLFALLTDFTDADCEHKDGEEKLLTLMRKSIERLNQRYAVRRSPVFYWLHRPRQWNEQEGVWMAWERKRGKLMQVNRLILNGEVEAFSQIVGEVSALQKVRYIIPLDADTQLPHDAARQMVATLAHPLNRPHVDPTTRRVTRGYAILQPLVSNGLDGANSSRYGAMMSGEAGVDPYTRQASDVYQDLFAEGTYIGKGIHDIAAFEQTLAERFPENQLLSHDLIESCYARSALISDVQLIEDYPSTYLADMNRRHRWVRGDWQIAFWLLPQAPNARGQWVSNPIRALGRWKIFDNLRRSLTPAALIAAVVGGWMLTPQLAWAWTLLLLALY
ncbi:MAG: protein ndvB, partial [Phycisphaeraceae bacterium]